MSDSKPRWEFEKVGMGYRCWAAPLATEVRLTHIKRSGENLTGELAISTHFKGIKTNNGLMHLARFNVLSSSTRHSLATQLGKRSPGIDIDWGDCLETLCQGVIMAEHRGTTIEETGQDDPRSTEDNFLLEPFVLTGRPSMIFGPGGVGKSLIGLTCAVSVATGEEIIPGSKPRLQGTVLYLDWETDKETINDRVQAICKGLGIKAPKILYRRCVRPLYEDAERLAEVIAERNVVLVVVDSAAYAMGTNERGMPEETVLRMHEGIRLMSTTTLIIDHVNKTDQREKPGKARPYGSAYKTNAVRLSWEIRQGQDKNDGRVHITCYEAKSNDTANNLQPVGLSLEWGQGVIRFAPEAPVEEVVEQEEGGNRNRSIPSMILELTSDGARIHKGRLPEYLPEGTKPNTIVAALKRLSEDGRIIIDEHLMVYQPSAPRLVEGMF